MRKCYWNQITISDHTQQQSGDGDSIYKQIFTYVCNSKIVGVGVVIHLRLYGFIMSWTVGQFKLGHLCVGYCDKV